MSKERSFEGKPYVGNPHVRFDEGEVASAEKPRRGSLLYKSLVTGCVLALCQFAFGVVVPVDSDFRLGLRRTPAEVSTVVTARSADSVEVSGTDGRRIVEFRYASGPVKSVVASRISGEEGESRFGLSVETAEGWFLEQTDYPLLTFPAVIGSVDADDRLMIGGSKGGVFVSPGRNKVGWETYCRAPENMVASFLSFWDEDEGWYVAAEDPAHAWKTLGVRRTEVGLELICQRTAYETGTVALPYDIVLRKLNRCEEPLVWQDFADLYRPFLARCRWSHTPFVKRADIPEWMKNASAMVRFSRQWLEHPEWIEAFTEWWRRTYGEGEVIAAIWGWEKVGTWWGPDYFPCHPSDEVFRREMEHLRSRGFHPFAWPSGYNWCEVIGRRDDGSFDIDYRETFVRDASRLLVRNRDGSAYRRDAFWLRDGALTALCGGVPASRDWFCGVARGLYQRGCELVQVDQQVGGGMLPCYAPEHGHPMGSGPWQTEAFAELLSGIRREVCAEEGRGVVAFEEPNPVHNDLIGIQDYRDLEARTDEYASVFNYLFHGYVPTFQSNPFRGDLYALAWQAADGQMPFHRMEKEDFSAVRPAVSNGGFEEGVDSVRGPSGWERIIADRVYRNVDVDEPVWNFTGYSNMGWLGIGYRLQRDEKHDGNQALLIDPELSTNDSFRISTVQIAQTIEGLRPGFYVLSAWAKSEHGGEHASLRHGNRKGERGSIDFPPDGSGWKRISGNVTVDDDGVLRVIVFVRPGACVYIDDVSLSDADGNAVCRLGQDRYVEFMRRWIALYRGEGRDFLAHGFQEKPPSLRCASLKRLSRTVPAVCHAAYRAQDGRRALVLANGTDLPQEVAYCWNGHCVTRILKPAALELLVADGADANDDSGGQMPDLECLRKELPKIFAGRETSFQHERLQKRLEAAERLAALPDRTMLMQAELDEFRSSFDEALRHWKQDPGNPAVRPVVIDVNDFGARGDGKEDEIPAFDRAIQAVRALGGRPSVLRVGAGDYLFGADALRWPTRRANLDFSCVTNCLLQCAGPKLTRFRFGLYNADGIAYGRSVNSTIQDVSCSYVENPYSETVVESYDPGSMTAVVEWLPGTLRPDDPRYLRSNRSQVCCVFNSDGSKSLDHGATPFFNRKADDLGGGRFRLHFDEKRPDMSKLRLVRGMHVVIPDRDNAFQGAKGAGAEFFNFSRVWFHNARSGAINCGLTHYSTMWHCRTVPPADGGMFSSNADTCYNARGTFLAHCEFNHMCDDGANSLGYGKEILSQEGDRTLLVPEIPGRVRSGDVVQILDALSGRFRATLRVARAERFVMPDGSARMRMLFDDALPDGIVTAESAGLMSREERYRISHGLGKVLKSADLLYAPTQFGTGFICYDNRIGDLRGCGINVQCPHSIIEGNVIENVSIALKLTGLTQWFEGTPPYDVLVRGNVFRNCRVGVQSGFYNVNGELAQERAIRDVAFVSNRFENVRIPWALESISDSTLDGLPFGGTVPDVLSRDALRPVGLGNAIVKGHVGKMQDLYLANRIFSDFARREIWKEAREAFEHPDDDVFKKPVGMWKGEFWGKLMISACRAAEYSGDASLRDFLHDEGLRLVALQHPDGYLGTYVEKEFVVPKKDAEQSPVPGTSPDWNWNLWCRKYTLWGLLSCYRLTGDKKLLWAADRAMAQQIAMLRRLGLKLCDTGTTSMRGLPPCSILKPLLWLYADTGKKEYLDYAREIVGYWNEDGNNAPQFMRLAATGKPMYTWYPDEIGRWGKAYELMSCLDGLLEFYRATGDRSSLELVKTVHRDIRDNETNPCLSVGYNDQFTGAARHLNGLTEPCDAVHWIRLNHDLFLITGDPSYVDALELAFYNAFLAAMRPDGKWGARCVLSHWGHYEAPPQSGMTLQHCCVNNLPRGFMDAAQTIAAESSDGTISICMYHDASVRISDAEVEISGDYPVRDDIVVRVRRNSAGKVRFRIPSWCGAMSVVDGGGTVSTGDAGWLVVNARSGDTTWTVHFGLRPRIVDLERNPYCSGPDGDLQGSRWVYAPEVLRMTPAAEVMYGPLLLAKSRKVGDTVDEIMDSSTVKGGGWTVKLTPRDATEGVWGAWTLMFEKAGASKSVGVCDFPSAAGWSGDFPEFSLFF